MQIVPNSYGVELREFNDCHNPPGPGGGQFCSKGGANVTFQADTTGFHDNQMDGRIVARVDGKSVGYLNYSVYQGVVQVQMVKVDPSYRRQGIGLALMTRMMEEVPEGTLYQPSMQTGEGAKLVAQFLAKVNPRTAERVGLNEDGTVTLLHGTTVLNAESILEHGFRLGQPEQVATQVEDEYGLPRGSVLNHPAFEFARGRQDLDRIHFTTDRGIANAYTVPEVLQDALEAAFYLIHPKLWHRPNKEVSPLRKQWKATEGRRLAQPAVLAVTVPWKAVGDHAFGRKLTLDEYRELQRKFGRDTLDNLSIPIAALGAATFRALDV